MPSSQGSTRERGLAFFVHHDLSMAPRRLPLLLIPLWLVIMLAIAAAGLYLGYRKPDLALALVFLFLTGAWLFWTSWHDTVRR